MKLKKGFTLIEVIVTTFIFSILMVILSTTFINLMIAQRRATNIQMVVENMNFVMESLTKEIRMASQFISSENECRSDLEIEHPTNPGIANGSIYYYYSAGDKSIHRMIKDNDGSKSLDTPLNSSIVEFIDVQFCRHGLGAGDGKQPRITIVASVHSKADPLYIFDIQTTVSMRNTEP